MEPKGNETKPRFYTISNHSKRFWEKLLLYPSTCLARMTKRSITLNLPPLHQTIRETESPLRDNFHVFQTHVHIPVYLVDCLAAIPIVGHSMAHYNSVLPDQT